MEDSMKIRAHKNRLAPLVTGTICYLFLVVLLANGIVGAFFGKVVVVQ